MMLNVFINSEYIQKHKSNMNEVKTFCINASLLACLLESESYQQTQNYTYYTRMEATIWSLLLFT